MLQLTLATVTQRSILSRATIFYGEQKERQKKHRHGMKVAVVKMDPKQVKYVIFLATLINAQFIIVILFLIVKYRKVVHVSNSAYDINIIFSYMSNQTKEDHKNLLIYHHTLIGLSFEMLKP